MSAPDPERTFHGLAAPSTPVEPDPAFAGRLRDRLRLALLLRAPAGSTSPRPTVVRPAVATPTVVPGGYMSQLIPYLAVRDARAAIAWYGDVLGAVVVGNPYVMDDDRIGHAELDLAGATVYLADEYPEMGVVAPDAGRSAVSLHLSVPDVDVAVARAAERGATVQRAPADAPYGRTGTIIDPQGHRWMLQQS